MFPAFKTALSLLLALIAAAPALADSCWMHNGSLMRLSASGAQRSFTYEVPRQGLASAGVRPGTLLFNGTKSGDWYSGTARVFSSACPGNPLEYYVEGPVGAGQTSVTLRGTREVYANCAATGQVTIDTLVFTYSHQC